MEAAWTNVGNYAILLKYQYIGSEDTGPIQHWTDSSYLSQVACVWNCASSAFYHKSAQWGGQCPPHWADVHRTPTGAAAVEIWRLLTGKVAATLCKCKYGILQNLFSPTWMVLTKEIHWREMVTFQTINSQLGSFTLFHDIPEIIMI